MVDDYNTACVVVTQGTPVPVHVHGPADAATPLKKLEFRAGGMLICSKYEEMSQRRKRGWQIILGACSETRRAKTVSM